MGTVMAAIAITYALLAVLELWRGPGQEASRWPIMLLLLGHAAAIPVRIPLAGSTTDPHPFHVNLLTFALFEAVFVCICAAYLFGGLAKDRIAAGYQRASLIDPLTGVANRRGFLQAGERLMVRIRFARRPAAISFVRSRSFKSINDKFGHHIGDAVISAFCQLATSLFGRPTYSAASEVGVREPAAEYRTARCPVLADRLRARCHRSPVAAHRLPRQSALASQCRTMRT
jgi:GGDEF domain-containing protein